MWRQDTAIAADAPRLASSAGGEDTAALRVLQHNGGLARSRHHSPVGVDKRFARFGAKHSLEGDS